MSERPPTERQARILEVIRQFSEEHGYPPSVREIGERVGLSSSSTVQAHLKSLERGGHLHRDPTKPRALAPTSRTARGERAPEFGILPIVGKVAAGVPITAAEYLEGEFVVPAQLARKDGTFMLRVQGDSMLEAAILDGDLIVVSPQPSAENGQIVVALVEGEATVKRFFREPGGRLRLDAANPNYAPIHSDDLEIVGKVIAVVRTL
ncbi:MAG: transcriptional repressor LexA [Vulcanimicrobiaceae bacterium]